MRDDPNEAELTERDLRYVWGLLSQKRRELEKRLEKSTFVPPPGKINMDEAKIARIDLILAKVERLQEEICDGQDQ